MIKHKLLLPTALAADNNWEVLLQENEKFTPFLCLETAICWVWGNTTRRVFS